MQTLTWNGAGSGTLISPFILDAPSGFSIEKSFDISFKNNYIAMKPEYAYFQIGNMVSIYLLATMQFDRKGISLYEPKNAIVYTAFLTDKINYVDGPYGVTVHEGISYLLKLQFFDIKSKSDGRFTGLWETDKQYYVNDMVLYQNNLYVTQSAQKSTYFIETDWIKVSVKNSEIMVADEPPVQYGLQLWIKPLLTIPGGGYVIEDLDNPEAIQEEESLVSENETESTPEENNEEELVILEEPEDAPPF